MAFIGNPAEQGESAEVRHWPISQYIPGIGSLQPSANPSIWAMVWEGWRRG
jgi:hypothetical protein